jgi:hypothetical protein
MTKRNETKKTHANLALKTSLKAGFTAGGQTYNDAWSSGGA